MWRELLEALKNYFSATTISTATIAIDNTSGTTDIVQPLFPASTPSISATLRRDPGDTGTVYIGSSAGQDFPVNPGDVLNDIGIDDLSKIYVRVPPGAKLTLYVLWTSR